jgi:hypothetical protein
VTTRLAVPAVALAVLAAAGCTSTPAATSGRSAPATSTATAPRPTVTPPDATCGRLRIRVLGVQGGRPVIVGTHAEFPSHAGQFVRVRIYATNEEGVFHTFHTPLSPVIDADGTTTYPNGEAMRIKRQSEDVVLGGENQAQFDLWYDLPTTARPVTVVLRQDLECARPMPLPALTRR